MTTSSETIEIRVERTISAPPDVVFDAWLDSSVPGTPFHQHDKLIIDATMDGLFYWLFGGIAHYGRFVQVNRPDRIQHSWMSRKTLGEETMVTVTLRKNGDETVMTLVHSGFPHGMGPISGCSGMSNDMAQAHEKGWNLILDRFVELLRNRIGPLA